LKARSRKYIGFIVFSACTAFYWSISFYVGGFDQVRRYGRDPGIVDWAFSIPHQEWILHATGLLGSIAFCTLLFTLAKHANRISFPNPRRIVFFLALAAFVFSALIRIFILDRQPTCDDELAYKFQAQVFTEGQLTAKPPPDTKAFEHLFLGTNRDRWFAQYSFGHPFILAIGATVKALDFTGPLCAALLVMAVFLLTQCLFDTETALLAAGLTTISPIFLCTGATLLSQNSATPLIILGIAFTFRSADSGQIRDAFFASIFLGASFWIRGLEPLLLGSTPMLFLLWKSLKSGKLPATSAAVLAAALLCLTPLLLLQWHLWGNPFWSNYQAYWWGYLESPLKSPFGFGPAPWDIAHTPLAGLKNFAGNWTRLETFLLGFPLASFAALSAIAHHRRQLNIYFALAGIPLTFIVLYFYFWPGLSDTGPQLYHACGALMIPFVAAGLMKFVNGRNPLHIVVVAAIVAGCTFWPPQLLSLRRVAIAADEIPRIAKKAGLENAVVFMRLRPWSGGHERSWVLGRPLPHPDLSDSILYLQTQGKPVDLEIARDSFPDRTPYYFRQIDGKAALIELSQFTGKDSLRQIAVERDVLP
jgi:Dolichyl-phosphate-mannose-protein mannosyltransferase